MRLIDWMKAHGKTRDAVAREGGFSRHTVQSWMQGRARPRAEMQRRLTEYTGGEVTANDFVETDVPPSTTEAA